MPAPNLEEIWKKGINCEAQDISMIGMQRGRTDLQDSAGGELETATFAAGCFWGVEEEFRKVKGVMSATVGYTGGWTENPTYNDVCTDRTGHAESIQIKFDPKQVTYADLLKVFWSVHNPTTKNRQGLDHGTQYRSAIFFHSPEQEAIAKKSKEELDGSGRFRDRIVTEIASAPPFYAAEEYHQKYYQKRGGGRCYF